MSVLKKFGELTAGEVIDCSYVAMAIVDLCAYACDELAEGPRPNGIGAALRHASQLMGIVHGAVEVNERPAVAAVSVRSS